MPFSRFATGAIRLLVSVAFWLGLGLTVHAHGSDSNELRVAISRTPLSLPLWVAQTQGYLKDEGVNAEYLQFNGGHKCRDALLAGQADLATSSEMAFLFGAASNPELMMLSRFVTNSTDTLFIVGRKVNEGGRWTERVKRIGTIQGTSAHYFLDLFLALKGVDREKVEVLFRPIETLGPDTASGDLDAAVFWNPSAANALLQFPEQLEEIKAPPIYSVSFNLLARRDEIDHKRAELVAFHRALARAVKFINENPTAAAKELMVRLDWTDAERARQTINTHNFQLGLPNSHLLTMDRQLAWMKANKLAEMGEQNTTVLNFVDRSILNQATMSQ